MKVCKNCNKKLGVTNKIGYCQDCLKLGVTKLGIHKCIESNCNNKVSKEGNRCKSCAGKGDRNSHYIDGRCKIKYYCKICKINPINRGTYFSGKGRCKSCAKKEDGISPLCIMKGKSLSESAKNKIRKSHIGLKHNDTSKEKMRQKKIGKYMGKNNHRYIDGRSLETKYCKCGKIIHWQNETCKECYNQLLSEKMSKEKHPNWIEDRTLIEYGDEFDDNLKEQVRFRDHYKCQICGCSQLENSRQLDCHHIDYNKKNNIFNNLISLCRSCHLKTNYNRDYWQDYFTKFIIISRRTQ